MGKLVLVLGGARSGKSAFARKLVQETKKEAVYIATARVTDKEMARRIARHRRERPLSWETIEEPCNLKKISDIIKTSRKTVLLDCLTVLLSNVLLKECKEPKKIYKKEENIADRFSLLADSAGKGRSAVIFVANEVGMGVCPGNYLGRAFRDIAGRVNQRVSEKADEVYFLVSGIAMRLK